MLALIQRVNMASVVVDGKVISSIENGMLVLLGVSEDDSEEDVRKIAEKLPKLRIYDDKNGKMNLSITETGGDILLVSQFTLLADLTRGLRPGFEKAAHPEKAEKMFNQVVEELQKKGFKVKTGVFGAHMHVILENDGPATFILNTRERRNKK